MTEYQSLDCLHSSIQDIEDLNAHKYRNITYLRIINSDALSSMKGLSKFGMLIDVNLSANIIEKIEDVTSLRLLQRLDLSCNKIRVITGLKALPHLTQLNLSGNKIVSIAPLEEMCGPHSKLKEVDLSGNNLYNIRELTLLESCVSLSSIRFHQDEEFSNLFCQKWIEYVNYIKKLKLNEEFRIDGTIFAEFKSKKVDMDQAKKMAGIKHSDMNVTNEQNADSNARLSPPVKQPGYLPNKDVKVPVPPSNVRNQLYPKKTEIVLNPPKSGPLRVRGTGIESVDTVTRKVPIPNRNSSSGSRSPNRTNLPIINVIEPPPLVQNQPQTTNDSVQNLRIPIYPIPNITQPPSQPAALQSEFIKLLGETDKLREEIRTMKDKVDRVETEKRELESRVAASLRTEERQRHLINEIDKTRDLLRDAQLDLEDLEESLAHEKKIRNQLEGEITEIKAREKEQSRRMDEALRKNVELIKEIEFANKETIMSKEEAGKLTGQVTELRRVIKGYEANLQNSHAESLKNNEIAIIRIEDLNVRLRESETKIAELKSQLTSSNKEKKDFYEEKVKLEASISNQLEAMSMSHRQEVNKMEKEYDQKMANMKENHSEQLSQAAISQENALNTLEAEFKTIVVNMTDKSRKQGEENKNLKNALSDSIKRTRELEELLVEMGAVVEGVRKEMRDKKQAQKQPQKQLESVPLSEYSRIREELHAKTKSVAEAESKLLGMKQEFDRLTKQIESSDNIVADLKKLIGEKEKDMGILNKENHLLKVKIQEQVEVVKRIEHKFNTLENHQKIDEKAMEEELEAVKTDLRIKAQLMNEKVAENEKLKSEISSKENQLAFELVRKSEVEENCNNRIEIAEMEYQKLKVKYQKKDQLLDEYEAQIESLSTDLENTENMVKRLRTELLEKGKIAEECYNRLNQIQAEKRLFEESQVGPLRDLERKLEAMSESIRQKDQRIRDLESAGREIEKVLKDRIKSVEEGNKMLLSDNATKEREIKALLNEISKQKKLAQENLANLTKIFS